MSLYYYLLYSLHSFYSSETEDSFMMKHSICATSTLLILSFFLNFYYLMVYLDLLALMSSKYYLLVLFAIVYLFNYKVFVEKEKYLEFNFSKDLKGGLGIMFFILIAKLNSDDMML